MVSQDTSEDTGVPAFIERLPESVPHAGWPKASGFVGLSFRAPHVYCPHCATVGDSSLMVVAGATAAGGCHSLIWHMVCESGHAHHYPATDYEDDQE